MARKTKDQKRVEELKAALQALLDATRMYQYTPPEIIRRAVNALHD